MNEHIGASGSAFDESSYREKLEEIEKPGAVRTFVDVVIREIWYCGLGVTDYCDVKSQSDEGECKSGTEMKRDGKFRETGFLHIETARRTHPVREVYVPSGIYRIYKPWLYIIGDEQTIYIFATKHLQALQAKYQVLETLSRRGVLMPLEDADAYCLRKIEFGERT